MSLPAFETTWPLFRNISSASCCISSPYGPILLVSSSSWAICLGVAVNWNCKFSARCISKSRVFCCCSLLIPVILEMSSICVANFAAPSAKNLENCSWLIPLLVILDPNNNICLLSSSVVTPVFINASAIGVSCICRAASKYCFAPTSTEYPKVAIAWAPPSETILLNSSVLIRAFARVKL